MNDLIGRQKLIKLLETEKEYRSNRGEIGAEKGLCYALEIVDDMPSAQPEIIRCKDCKYKCETEDGEYDPYDIVCDYWASDGLKESDYCSYAERKE